MSQTPNLKIDDVIENFQVKAFLGNGSFGAVYKVIDPNGNVYALKCIFKSRFSEANGWVGNLIMNEVEALQKLDNQYIVNLITTFNFDYEGQTLFCILLEFCDGGNLLDYQNNMQNTFDQQNAIIFFKQILQGMKEIHQKRIIHRDLKLPNILIHNNQIKIADFGFCHLLKLDASSINLNLGTLGTQAPEILDNQPYGLKSDMFSIGVILYQLLFFDYPFSVNNEKDFIIDVTNNNPPSFQKNGREVEKYLEDLLTKMLKKDPTQRLDWPDLFKSKLFTNSYSKIFGLSTIDDENIIDPIQSIIFYEQQICNNYIQSNIQKIDQEPTYLNLVSQIQFLIYTQEFSYSVYHRQVLMCLFPCFLIQKLLYQKQQEYENQNKNKIYDVTNTHQILTYQYQVVMANYAKLKKLNIIQENWESELINLQQTQQFLNILSEAILKYLTNLRQEIIKDTEQYGIDWQQILIFDNDLNKQQRQNVLQKIKFFILIHKVLSLQELEQELFDLLVNNPQTNTKQLIFIYQQIKLP
ncbi:unnamed protein product [Paramecium primaurelia]|uniref:Protein kinase domain-containing protein n=1 Tax=Paramecium primaurelia TaxID=5886 RepID=A0A8S1LEH4_PARPR|nr:unnamed protein product [Paramecium primaurelia]